MNLIGEGVGLAIPLLHRPVGLLIGGELELDFKKLGGRRRSVPDFSVAGGGRYLCVLYGLQRFEFVKLLDLVWFCVELECVFLSL